MRRRRRWRPSRVAWPVELLHSADRIQVPVGRKQRMFLRLGYTASHSRLAAPRAVVLAPCLLLVGASRGGGAQRLAHPARSGPRSSSRRDAAEQHAPERLWRAAGRRRRAHAAGRHAPVQLTGRSTPHAADRVVRRWRPAWKIRRWSSRPCGRFVSSTTRYARARWSGGTSAASSGRAGRRGAGGRDRGGRRPPRPGCRAPWRRLSDSVSRRCLCRAGATDGCAPRPALSPFSGRSPKRPSIDGERTTGCSYVVPRAPG